MHPLQNGSQVNERPANKPVSGLPGYFTESGENNVPSYPGADWFNNVIDEFLTVLASLGVNYDSESTNNLSNTFKLLQESILDGSIYSGSNGYVVVDGDIVPIGTTYLSVLILGKRTIVKIPSTSSGVISQLSESNAMIGGVLVDFCSIIEYPFASVGEMLDSITKVGFLYSTGLTLWKKTSSLSGDISDFSPIGHVHLSDYKQTEVSLIISELINLGYKVHAESTEYYTCNNVELPDAYVEITGGATFDAGSNSRVFFQQIMAENPVTLQSNINKGNRVCVLSDANIPIGSIVRLVSNKMISRLWTEDVVRPYYQEGEINKVISKNGNIYTFETEFFFDYDQLDMQEASWYTPRDGLKIEANLINDASAVFSGNTGLEIWQQDDNVELSIKTERFNSQGVLVGQCWKPNVARVESIGGDDASGLNYALNLADGTRFAAVGLVRGDDTRHSITLGGSGRAIPLQGNVTKSFNTNTNQTSVAIPGIDMHGNSGGFIFNECITDTTINIAGVNNHVNIAICGDGWFTIAGDDGGFNCSIGTIKMTNPYRITNASYPVLGLHIDHFNVEYTKVVADSQFNLNANGTTTIGRLVAKNRGVNEATSNADATNKAQPTPWSFRANTDIDNAEISGFSYVRMVGDNISIKKLTIDNICWETSVNAGSAVYFQTSAKCQFIGQLVSKSSNPNLTYTERMIGFESGANFSAVTIMNVSGFDGRPRVIDVPATVTKLRLFNSTLAGISSSVSPDQKVWGWDGLADA
ncbi:hypothetical protein ACSTKZ_07895 [Vibrio parahaemolyticus]